MSGATAPEPVGANEWLARFVTVDKWIRADQTIRADAFIPPKDLELSVTRHLNFSEEELWAIGKDVVKELSKSRPATLHGRADISVAHVLQQRLRAESDPLPKNRNHAHIAGWPAEKSVQKNIAQELAAAAGKAVLLRKTAEQG